MTTDGVHDFINKKSIKNLLESNADLNVVAQNFILKAAENNSDDNLTCQLVRVEQLPEFKEDAVIRSNNVLPFPPPLSVGDKLDGYEIVAEIHASKRTQIYRATDCETGEMVILKTPSILYDDDTRYIEHFLHEEWAGKRLNHANVLKILPTHRERTKLYYVTECLDGQTLREWIEANPKPDIKVVVKIIGQLVKGLQAFHRMEMLHQDLKPENLMFDAKGVLKIIDFGSVKIAGIAEISPQYLDEEENVLGTLNYTAPEYHNGQRGNVKSDLFSVGVIAYELLNGALPFGETLTDKPTAAYFAKLIYVPSSQHNEMIPNWMDGALRKATAINPAQRYETLSEFLYDFTHPNATFLKAEKFVPLIERNATLFWKSLSLALLISNLVLLYQLI
jgi:serine/threonine protein kinase